MQGWQSRILVVDNMNMESRDHGPGGDGHHRGVPHMFTCTEMLDENQAGGMSVDQKIANAIGGESPFKSIHLANRPVYRDTNWTSLWTGPGSVITPDENPWRAFDRLFAGVTPGAPTVTEPGHSLKKSVLDHSLAETAALRSRLSSTDHLLTKLDSVPEGTGTMLDSTVVVWASALDPTKCLR